VPESLQVPPDPLRLRLDFHEQAVLMTEFGQQEPGSVKIVSAADIAHALATSLSYSTGILPENALWWSYTADGPVVALYEPPRIRKLALQTSASKPPRRFAVPMPGLIFLCRPARQPWVYAVSKRPCGEKDIVYHAPLCNLHEDGKSCPGNHRYPANIGEIPESFFRSFFTATDVLSGRSKKFPDNVVRLWEWLDGKKRYPFADLMKLGTVKDIMEMRI